MILGLRGICAIVWPESLEAGKMEEPQLDDAKVSLDWGPDVPNFGNCKQSKQLCVKLFALITHRFRGI
jgi:hypothetical protein